MGSLGVGCLMHSHPEELKQPYRGDLQAALEQIDSLKGNTRVMALPSKRNLLDRLRKSLTTEPERWTKRQVWWESSGGLVPTDVWRTGWIRDFPVNIGGKAFGFYLTGLFWIGVGTVERDSRGAKIVGDVVRIFCPGFRRLVRKHGNWRLLTSLERESWK